MLAWLSWKVIWFFLCNFLCIFCSFADALFLLIRFAVEEEADEAAQEEASKDEAEIQVDGLALSAVGLQFTEQF